MEITPKKCCIKYEPPTLVLFYEIKDTGKLHRRSIPIRKIEDDNVLQNLLSKTRHSKYLKEFQQDQIKRLLKMLSQKQSSLNFELNDDKTKIREKLNVDIENTDLNKLDNNKLNEVKDVMNESFEQNQVKPGDENWKYNVEVDFKKTGIIESSAWDDEDESDMEF